MLLKKFTVKKQGQLKPIRTNVSYQPNAKYPCFLEMASPCMSLADLAVPIMHLNTDPYKDRKGE